MKSPVGSEASNGFRKESGKVAGAWLIPVKQLTRRTEPGGWPSAALRCGRRRCHCATHLLSPMARKPNNKCTLYQFIIGFIYPLRAFCNRGPINHSRSMHLFNILLVTRANSKNFIEILWCLADKMLSRV